MEKWSHLNFALLFFFLSFFLSSCGTIVQLLDLSEIRVYKNSSQQIYLENFFEGQNLTYELSGSYQNDLQAPIPIISQRISLYSSFPKATSSLPPNSFQLIQQNVGNPSLIYTLEGQSLCFWDISDLMSIKLLSAQAISGGKLVAFSQINISTNPSFIILQNVSNGYLVSFYNQTQNYGISLINELQVVIETDMELQEFLVYPALDSIFSFILLKSQIYVTKFNSQNNTSSIYSVINNTSVQTSSFSPIYLYTDGFYAYVCDAENGVFVLNLGNFLSEVGTDFTVISLLRVPLSLGQIYSCSYYNQYLNVATSQGIVIYSCPSMSFVRKFDKNLGENESLEEITRLESTWNRAEGYFISNITTSFRLYVPSETYSGSLEISEDTTNLFGSDALLCSSPPYIWIAGTSFWIFNTPNYLYVYQFNLAALSTVSINQNYTFSGDLKVSNANNEIIVPVTIYGIDLTSMDIYNWRGNYLGNEYRQPYNINLYANINIDDNSQEIYLPISNYFSGQNISYSLSLLQQTHNCSITVINPPKFLLASSINVQSKPSFSPVLILSDNAFVQILVAIPTESSYSYVFSLGNNGLPDLRHQISCSNSSMASNNAVTFTMANRYLIIECIIQDQNTGTYDVDWDVYLFDLNYEYKYIATYKWFQIMYSAKIIQACYGYLAALRGNQIELYYFNTTDSSFVPLPAVNSNTVEGLLQFLPIDITVGFNYHCASMYVYDFNAGLTSINLTNFQTPYQATIFNIAESVQDIYAKIAWMNNEIFIISPQSEAENSFLKVKFKYDNYFESVEYLPVFPGCIYTFLSVSYHFLMVLCENIKANEMLIFDFHDFAFESLYTAVPISNIGAACIFALNNINFLYIYEGDFLHSYYLAQSIDNFTTPASSNLVSPYSFEAVVWAEIQFNFTSPVREVQTLDFELTAENEYNKNSAIISINVIPRGTVVQINENFDLSSSNLTSGNRIEIVEAQVTETIPLKSVKGNNVKFGVFDKDNLIAGEQECNATAPICITSKYNIEGNLEVMDASFDSCQFENTLYISSVNAVYAYNLSVYPYTYITKYDLMNVRGAYSTNCYKINSTPIQNILIASCYVYPTDDSMYSTIYLAVINLNNLTSSTLIPQTYSAAAIKVVNEQSDPFVYVYDGQCINIYGLQLTNNTYSLIWISSIDSEQIGVNMLLINSILHLNQTDVILLDSSSGFLWAKATVEDNNKIYYELYKQYAFPSLFINYVSSYTAATLLSDQKTILATENNGKVLLINIDDSELVVKNQFPQLANETSIWSNSIYSYEQQSLALYPIANSTFFLWIRVLNYNESFDNSVFIDIPITNLMQPYQNAQFKIYILPETTFSLRIILEIQYSMMMTSSIFLGEIRLTPTATFAPIEGYSSKTLKLVGYIDESGSEEKIGKLDLQWGTSKEKEKASSHLDWYSRWYVWVSILGGIALIIVILIVAIRKRRKRRRLVSISLLSIDKEYRYSISDL